MARQAFLDNVRTAVRLVTPRVEADAAELQPDHLERMLRSAALWLTPKAVEGFDAQDFVDLPPKEQESLTKNVEGFVTVASAVPSSDSATPQQIDTALPCFMEIVSRAAAVAKNEWSAAANALVDDAEQWAAARGWPNQRFTKTITENLMGAYQLDKLVLAVYWMLWHRIRPC